MRILVKLAVAIILTAAPAARGQGHFLLEPISASGAHTVVSPDEIHLLGGNQTVRVELRLSQWAAIGGLKGWQARVDSASYANNDGAALSAALLGCTSGSQCAAAYEFGSRCVANNCTAAFINPSRPDWVHIDEEICGTVIKDVSLANPNYLWFATTSSDCLTADNGADRYGGGLVLFVPPGARGLYEVKFIAAETFMLDTLNTPTKPELTSLRIKVLCTAQADCDDGVPCTNDACQSGTCEHEQTMPLDANGDCLIGADDLVFFSDCLTGPDPAEPADAECVAAFDVASGGTVDLADFAMLQNSYPPGG